MPVTMQRGLVVALTLFVLGLTPVIVFAEADSKKADGEVSLPKVVATVNGVEIESKIIAFQLNRAMRENQKNFSPDEQRTIIMAIIDKEIVRELVNQEGKSQQVKVDPELVDKELMGIREPYKDKEEFDKALKARGLTEDELKESIKVDLTAKKLIDDQVRGKVKITDEDVKKYYEGNKEKFFRPDAFRASHIFIAVYPPELVKKSTEKELHARQEELDKVAEKKINDILKELKAGGDFSELAKKYSHDAGSAPNGGDLDFIYKGVFDPEFDAAISKMKAGDTSDVVKTSYGYHLIKLVEIKPAEQAPYAEMEVAIQKHLFMEKAQEKVGRYLQGLRKKAKIEILL
ncbi:MAG: peptidylprolyl isomerase [Nitrospinae bacterium]|jgi:peptidyl-prolyl cis-trans isomerase C|nr:peptidylprolyl isomerase [Nitrospinota bacterium]MDA1110361.1 peptidylprolyl isomerase [Nitrospinota bacterium]